MIHQALLALFLLAQVLLAAPVRAEEVEKSEVQHVQTLSGVGRVTGSLWQTFTEKGAENKPFCALAAELTEACAARLKKMAPPKSLAGFQKQLAKTLDTSIALYTAAAAGDEKQLEALGKRLAEENKELQEIWKKLEGRYR